jgi:GH15 family glucan-1,4-alpha-glucosidase
MDNLNYGIIGNCRSAALISERGSIDWCCLPEYDDASIFARLLDKEKGGHFGLEVEEHYHHSQRYIRQTNILKTVFESSTDAFEVIDFMPRYRLSGEGINHPPDLVRLVRPLRGRPRFRVAYQPRLEYAEHETRLEIIEEYLKAYTAEGAYDSLYLYSDVPLDRIIKGEEHVLEQSVFFLVSYNQKLLRQDYDRAYLLYQRTKTYWLNWSRKTRKFTEYNDRIARSALVLKLLSYDKSGAVLAAATTSLPETIGEERNWDYRFCWLRDASMVVKVMAQVGQAGMASSYLDFIVDVVPDKDEKIQIMYGIRGERELTEHILEHLDGYEGSKPVRIGNAAYEQKQNDIYGVLMDVFYQQLMHFDVSLETSEALWTITRSIVHIVEHNWEEPDRGIWEIRNENKHFTFSKVLCWVAVDRGVKIARALHKSRYVEPWTKLRASIRKDIEEKAWNKEVGAFTQSYGSKHLDAANLLMLDYGFADPSDPLFVSTVRATYEQLCKDGLMYRYKNEDDFGLPSSSFTICTFWMIKALWYIGERDQAIHMFDNLLGYSNHLGLFSEDLDFESKRMLGNFPQAYSHLALIETAMLLSGGRMTDEASVLATIHKKS